MSLWTEKLFEEQQPQSADYCRLLRAVFGPEYENALEESLNRNTDLADTVDNTLDELYEDGTMGELQRYFIEQYYLYGKSKEEIAADMVAHIDLFVKDLESMSLRTLRHPEHRSKLKAHLPAADK